ncbi:MAG: tetratricopeptide repeat protein [Chitinispirillaceae bacterium]|nr:tetratricopeptide repeat protein [Chitinispirillaceae bacterium]
MNYHEQSEEILQRALILLNQHNYEQARVFAEQAAAQNPDNSRSLYVLALVYSHFEKELPKALDTIERAVSLDPMESTYLCLKAFIFSKIGRYAAALTTADSALSISPDSSECFLEKGRALMGMQRWRDAETAFHDALAIDPDDINAGNMLTIVLQMQQRGEESNLHAESMLQKDPQNAYSHANAGWTALRESNLIKAREHFLEALRLESGLESARLGIIETFKAQSPLYRGYLKYVFFMSRFSGKNGIMIIVGFYIAYRILYRILSGANQFLATTLAIAYLTFALWSWVARGVGNFMLLMNSFARSALTKAEKIEAAVVGGNVIVGLPLLISGITFDIPALFMGGVSMIWSAFPFSISFTNENKTGRFVYGAAGVTILIAGLFIVLAGTNIVQFKPPQAVISLVYIISIGVIWMGSFGVLRK